MHLRHCQQLMLSQSRSFLRPLAPLRKASPETPSSTFSYIFSYISITHDLPTDGLCVKALAMILLLRYTHIFLNWLLVNFRCFICLSCVILVILIASVTTATFFILDFSYKVIKHMYISTLFLFQIFSDILKSSEIIL